MVGAASGLVLGFLIATAYGAGFHVILGGAARRIPLYLFVSWIGFALGHIIGDMTDFEFLNFGALHLFTASLGSWAALAIAWWLTINETADSSSQ